MSRLFGMLCVLLSSFFSLLSSLVAVCAVWRSLTEKGLLCFPLFTSLTAAAAAAAAAAASSSNKLKSACQSQDTLSVELFIPTSLHSQATFVSTLTSWIEQALGSKY